MKKFYWHLAYRKGNLNDKKTRILGTYESKAEAEEALQRARSKYVYMSFRVVRCGVHTELMKLKSD